MTRDELLTLLREIKARQDAKRSDIEGDHCQADGALLAFINDPEITKAFDDLTLWYA